VDQKKQKLLLVVLGVFALGAGYFFFVRDSGPQGPDPTARGPAVRKEATRTAEAKPEKKKEGRKEAKPEATVTRKERSEEETTTTERKKRRTEKKEEKKKTVTPAA
jgi:hypothetical protein